MPLPRVVEAISGPRQGTRSLGEGSPTTCADCGLDASALVVIHVADGAWCVGTECDCPENPWYTRESDDFDSLEQAVEAWRTGEYRSPARQR